MTFPVLQGGAAPAFPIESHGTPFAYGMTLRQYYAAKVVEALVAASCNPHLPGDPAVGKTWPSPEELAIRRARAAWLQADALIMTEKE